MLEVPLVFQSERFHDELVRVCVHLARAGDLFVDGIRRLDPKSIESASKEIKQGIALWSVLMDKLRTLKPRV
jgi:hypothetical protein